MEISVGHTYLTICGKDELELERKRIIKIKKLDFNQSCTKVKGHHKEKLRLNHLPGFLGFHQTEPEQWNCAGNYICRDKIQYCHTTHRRSTQDSTLLRPTESLCISPSTHTQYRHPPVVLAHTHSTSTHQWSQHVHTQYKHPPVVLACTHTVQAPTSGPSMYTQYQHLPVVPACTHTVQAPTSGPSMYTHSTSTHQWSQHVHTHYKHPPVVPACTHTVQVPTSGPSMYTHSTSTHQ